MSAEPVDTRPVPSASQLRRDALGSALRMLLAGAAVLATYLIIPLDWFDGRWSAALLLIGGLTLYGLVVTRRMVQLSRAESPMARLGESLVVVIVLLVVIFAFTYVVMSRNAPDSFNVALDKNAALYFSMTITATTGFGDIVADSAMARNFVSLQMFINLVVLAVAVRGVTLAAQYARKKRQSEAPSDAGGATGGT